MNDEDLYYIQNMSEIVDALHEMTCSVTFYEEENWEGGTPLNEKIDKFLIGIGHIVGLRAEMILKQMERTQDKHNERD